MGEDVVDGDVRQASSAWLAERIHEPSASGISATVARLVRSGELAPQTRLPTVRALATRLGVSPATVSTAWTSLRKQRVVDGGGRRGIWVREGLSVPRPARYENISHLWPGRTLNLSRAVPDPALLPDIRTALSHVSEDRNLHSYEVVAISDPLREAAAATWPFPPENWLAVNGGYEGIQLLLATSVVHGDHVAVEDPATPRLLDIIDQLGARVLPVATDASGPVPASLAAAMRRQPAAFVYEPRSSSRLAATITAERRDALAAILSTSRPLIVEDDGLGHLSDAPYHGMASLLPHSTVLVRTYSKSHSPDLRLAVMGGGAAPLERARVYRQFGAGWTSRIVQNALAWMLLDPGCQEQVRTARRIYAQRRHDLVRLLEQRGVPVANESGLAVWVPVLNEREALLVLASHGIAVAGAAESWTRQGPAAVRVATGQPIPNIEAVADAIALASTAT
ncbi:GntR family transcriptional regulator [Intrasporangium chromatireducens Q5-1]|uniref:GntR family transcriptional regulator n=1 Tax=Intrasporangium chromatireducens Q5-1 TaxID=584657 RepID=W9GLK6_9MICO|nr:PLP-dependent aminotransferase family protein [Intrasporangium chromatireducens]EWT04784.1 GntR family transcriptional regulator [Intrasporangium chromatireducens Q5-1]